MTLEEIIDAAQQHPDLSPSAKPQLYGGADFDDSIQIELTWDMFMDGKGNEVWNFILGLMCMSKWSEMKGKL